MMCGPTARELEVLEAYARIGSYKLVGQCLGISPRTVRNLLVTLRHRYGADSSIQAYRAALAAGDLRRSTTVR